MSCEIQDRPASVLVQKSQVVLTTTCEFLRWNGGHDAGDLKIIELVEKWTRLNVLEKEIFKSNPKTLMEEKSWRTWKSNQNIMMDEELVQNVVMGENFVKNFVMGAKIDPKVEMDISMFELGGWKILQNNSRKLLEEFMEFQAEIHSS